MQFVENRSFLIIYAKPAMAEWVAQVENEEVNPAVEQHRVVYLVPPVDIPSPEQVEKLVERHCAAIFENELFSWYTDRSVWPTDRDFETFRQWFSYEYIEEGFDTGSDGIVKE